MHLKVILKCPQELIYVQILQWNVSYCMLTAAYMCLLTKDTRVAVSLIVWSGCPPFCLAVLDLGCFGCTVTELSSVFLIVLATAVHSIDVIRFEVSTLFGVLASLRCLWRALFPHYSLIQQFLHTLVEPWELDFGFVMGISEQWNSNLCIDCLALSYNYHSRQTVWAIS